MAFIVTLLLGRSGSGKSTSILQKMRQMGAIRAQILLVPEQASYETERRLCIVNGNGVSLYSEVFSFTSLEHRVVTLAGGGAKPVLDQGGRLLVLHAALKSVSGGLSVLNASSRKPEFLSGLMATVDELKSCCVSPEGLYNIAQMAEGLTQKKLQDISLIYGAYHAMTSQGPADPRDRLTQLAECLQSFPFAVGKDLYLDGFTDFTPQEEQVILALMRQCHSMTVSLTCDQLQQQEEEDEIFAAARHTARLLLRMAKENHIPVNVQMGHMSPVARTPALAHLEQALFSEASSAYPLPVSDEISIFAAGSAREEVSWVAGKIRDLLQGGQIRCRDIAVAARDIKPYQNWITSIFTRFQIPVYQSAMESILQKPIFMLVTSALDTVTGNYAYENIFRYLKTGLGELTQEECDELENYILLWNLRGNQWKAPFTMHPRGYQQGMEPRDEVQLKRLNEIRCKVIGPFGKISANQPKSVKEQVLSLYEFLEEIHLPEKLEGRAEELLRRGEPELALEYRQLWDILCNALEQCVSMIGDSSMELEEFSRLLRLLFAQYTVGSIPTSLDRVITGELPRLANRQVKVLFILGADDGSIPQFAPASGLLSEEDRALLSDYGVALATGTEAQMSRELTILYTACAQPTKQLHVTWSRIGEGGAEKRPSILVERLLTLFPEMESCADPRRMVQNDPISLQLMAFADPVLRAEMKCMPEFSTFEARLTQAAQWRRGSLSQMSTEKLYGKAVPISASKLDRYKSCHFAYFLQYGLKAKPRKAAGFHAPEYGSFVHYVLEHVLRAGEAAGGAAQCSREQIQGLTKDAVRTYIRDVLGGMEQQTPRFRYLFLRLQRTVSLVVENVLDELRQSSFSPIYFELGFGGGKELPPVEFEKDGVTLYISGFVDRVDGWVQDNRIYIKVVDYKTGRKSFDFTEVWNGLGLQMLLYLFTLTENRAAFHGLDVVPAGALYLPARDAVISGSRDMEADAKRRLIDKELVRRGLVLDEPAVLEALERPGEDGVRFLPVRVSAKTGKISGDSLVSAERLGRLKLHIEKILGQICGELARGEIAADPFWRGPNQNACQYCDYAAACHFDESLGEDRRRWISSVQGREFWSYLEEGEGEADGTEANEGTASCD